MAAVIKELSAHLGGGPGAVFSAWSLYLLLAAGAVTMLLASHALAAGPLAAYPARIHHFGPAGGQPARRVPVRRAHPHRRAALAGEALALAVVIAGAAALSRSSLIADENTPPPRQHQPALSSANASPDTRPRPARR